jgi:SNF2 family DNA or RNA helicase
VGVISRFAVRRFLRRPLRDSGKAKLLSPTRVDRKLARLDPPARFATKPYQHQKITFLLNVKYPGYLDLLDMGGGKTWISLNVIRWRRRAGQIKRALVLVPNTANVAEWVEQANQHTPSLSVAGIDQATKEDRIDTLHGKQHITVMTYMGFLRYTNDPELEDLFYERFQLVVCDECSFIKNHTSETFKTLRRLRRTIPYWLLLTGTPFDKSPSYLWAQFFLVDQGGTLGPTLGLYRAAFFKEEKNYWSDFPKYVFDRSNKKQLSRMLRHSSIRYGEQECSDLPKSIYHERPLSFSDETWAYYDKLVGELADAQGNFTLVDNVYGRLRRLTSGYLVVKNPEGDKTYVVFKNNPKLDNLIELLREIPEDEKVIVWNVYHKTGDIICDRLRQEKVSHLRLYGKTRNKKEVRDRFRAGKVRVLVCSRSGAYGLNLQVANHAVFYEQPDSSIVRQQMEKRIRRPGQTRRTHIWDLLVRKSIDPKILKAVKAGRDLFQDLFRGKELLWKTSNGSRSSNGTRSNTGTKGRTSRRAK